MSSLTSNKLISTSILVGTCAVLCVAIVVQAQYNTYDSGSNSDSDGSPILTNAELGKLVRNSARAQASQNMHRYQNQQQAATRNLHSKQQPMQYAPTQHRRQFGNPGGEGGFNDYSNLMGGVSPSASHGRGSNANNDDDDESGNFGPNFGSNFDGGDNDGESNANTDGQPMNLNQAASGYPGSHGDYENAGVNADFGPSGVDGSDFGPSEGFGGEGRRAKSASSLAGRNYGLDDDAGAPQYGPNSAVNSGDRDGDDEGRAGYAPEGQADGEGDDD